MQSSFKVARHVDIGIIIYIIIYMHGKSVRLSHRTLVDPPNTFLTLPYIQRILHECTAFRASKLQSFKASELQSSFRLELRIHSDVFWLLKQPPQ